MIDFYGYKKCDTCRRAEKYLQQKNIDYRFIDITEKPPPKKYLQLFLKNGEMKHLFNTSGQEYRRLNIKEKIAAMKPGEAVNLLSKNGRLVKRPLVSDGKSVTVGFKDDFKENWP